MDQTGSFWTYPDVGGPFHGVDEADDAINHFVDVLRHGTRYSFLLVRSFSTLQSIIVVLKYK
jgi:hypothetical protein